ncbi:hypothetical protein ACFE04_011952 [Oxalis oulophora]
MIRGGRNYVVSAPAFSNDCKKLLVCISNTVCIFSTTTALQITSLEGHTAPVTSVIVDNASASNNNNILCFCWTASLDGTIKYWDFFSSVPHLLKSINIRFPIFNMVIPSITTKTSKSSSSSSNEVFAYLSVKDVRKQQKDGPQQIEFGKIVKCNLTKSRLSGGVVLKETKKPVVINVSPNGKYIGIRVKRKIHIWKVPEAEADRVTIKKISLCHTKNISVLAFHPTQRIVAAGDVTGRILLWRGFGDRTFSDGNRLTNENAMDEDEEKPGVRGDDDADSCTTWHWHPSKVNLLSFSEDGAYLYSGGNEGVLVVWQLDTGKKKFLPRIGSPLLHLTFSSDPLLSSISCSDNQIHMLKMPSMDILKSISGIKPACPLPENYEGSCSGVAFDYASGLVALRTENYCLQLYSLFNDREVSTALIHFKFIIRLASSMSNIYIGYFKSIEAEIFSFQVRVCERNYQPGDEITVTVNVVAFSLDGSIMGTSEEKISEDGIGGLVCLKFWIKLPNEDFTLSTIIYEPHRDAGISAIAFHPNRRMAVSSSHGGDFKIWVCKDEIEQKDEALHKPRWTCHAVGSYKKKAMTSAAFSADGSVLAVAAENVVTLWDPENNVLVGVIGQSPAPISSLTFVGNSDYLVTASPGSKPELSIWSLSNMSLSWSWKLNVEAVATSTELSYFAVLSLVPESKKCRETILEGRDGVILLFNITDPVPVAIWSVTKAKGGSLAFLKPDSSLEDLPADSQALLTYINSDHEFVVFDPYGKETNELIVTHKEGLIASEETGHYGYSSLYGELPDLDTKRNQIEWNPSVPSERPWETIFNGPSHNLPPLTKLCSAFLESLLEKRAAVVE